MDGCEAKRRGLYGDGRECGRNTGASGQDRIMRYIKGRWAVLALCAACAGPVAAQSSADGATVAAPPCQTIAGQAEINGAMQQITGLACQQPDGTWQIVQGDDNDVALYPSAVYPYYDPWYWSGVVTVGFGGPFIFVDRFHHRYALNHIHFSRVRFGGVRVAGGWHGGGGMHGSWGGAGGMRR